MLNKIITYGCVLFALLTFLFGSAYLNERTERKRLSGNQETLLHRLNDSIEHYRTRSNDYAASVRILQLSKSELEKNCSNLADEIHDMGIKLKRVEAAAAAATSTNVQIVTKVRDSIIYIRDSAGFHIDSVKRLTWKDPWVTLSGELRGDDLTASIESRDTLIQVIHRVPKRFLFFRWGTREIRQEIKTSNPHNKIVYSEFVKIK